MKDLLTFCNGGILARISLRNCVILNEKLESVRCHLGSFWISNSFIKATLIIKIEILDIPFSSPLAWLLRRQRRRWRQLFVLCRRYTSMKLKQLSASLKYPVAFDMSRWTVECMKLWCGDELRLNRMKKKKTEIYAVWSLIGRTNVWWCIVSFAVLVFGCCWCGRC